MSAYSQWARRWEGPHDQWVVLYFLTLYADKDGAAFPSVAALAIDVHYDDRTVRRMLQLLTIPQNNTPSYHQPLTSRQRRVNGRQGTTEYTIHISHTPECQAATLPGCHADRLVPPPQTDTQTDIQTDIYGQHKRTLRKTTEGLRNRVKKPGPPRSPATNGSAHGDGHSPQPDEHSFANLLAHIVKSGDKH